MSLGMFGGGCTAKVSTSVECTWRRDSVYGTGLQEDGIRMNKQSLGE